MYKNFFLYSWNQHPLASQVFQHIHIPFEYLSSFHYPLISTTFPLSTWTRMLFIPRQTTGCVTEILTNGGP
ncbi:hypothetical protein Lalb_Chr19g0134701 [Lupinus albus]|uniref:Uncharacterized protein n=1 Tax=Lupinus albus TaxID=3870 RepID=A0A6A4P223_LUPAL|nr:hypothetical protein Lalb_Chr19g0134701 [Lupinus albus]